MRLDMIVDLQFGSTGKGLLAGYLAKSRGHDTLMTAWAPNAGHTFIDKDGRKFVHTMLANGIVGPNVRRVMIGPGSILSLDQLLGEIQACWDIIDGQKISIFIHANAGVVTLQNIADEQGPMTAIGSTKKGVGEAMISKIRRDPKMATTAKHFENHPLFWLDNVHLVNDTTEWLEILDLANNVLVEGAQGFSLSIHHGLYPFTTSRDVTPMQIAADCGIPFGWLRRAQIYGTARTYPIRVANRYDSEGNQVGWSGPSYDDQQELDWAADLGMKAELTTVTKLPRRIFTYSDKQMSTAIKMCQPETVFLNFVNYIKDFEYFRMIYESLQRANVNRLIYGIGPREDDIIYGFGCSAEVEWLDIRQTIG